MKSQNHVSPCFKHPAVFFVLNYTIYLSLRIVEAAAVYYLRALL